MTYTHTHTNPEWKGFNRWSATKKQSVRYDSAVIYDTIAAAPRVPPTSKLSTFLKELRARECVAR